MPSAIRSAVVLALACSASAAEDAAVSLRGSRALSEAAEGIVPPGDVNSRAAAAEVQADTVENITEQEMTSLFAAAGVADGGFWLQSSADLAALVVNESELLDGNISEEALELQTFVQGASGWGGWSQGGDKMWGGGAGTESINSGNIRYYDRGMYAARSRCGGAGCALIVNPPGHRSVNQFHIHFVHYAAYGSHLKHRLEDRVCRSHGWHGGGLPCGGRAAFFRGFPPVFTVARGGGSIAHASVIAWPGACGGRGTIVELAYGCSIEHQIRGDYDPRKR